jgi:hypothetical protein
MKLTIYTDESMAQVQEVREVPRMKIPYRTATAVLNMLGDLDMENMNEMAILGMVLKNEQHLTAVVRATFGLAEEDLERIDVVELGDLAREIVAYVVQKMADLGIDLGGESSPNPQAQAQTTA